MPPLSDISSLLLAGGGFAVAIVLGLVLRALLSSMVRRSAAHPAAWDRLGWNLLKGLALPVTAVIGLWWAAEMLNPPEPARGIVDRVLLVVIVLAVALAVARLAANVVLSVTTSRSGADQSASIFVNITRIVVLAIGFLVVLQTLGISITPMLTAVGIGGLAIALALQDTLANLFAGIHILASRKVQPGDFVQLDSGEDGYVVDITWRNTTVRQLAGNIVVVPNSHFAGAIVTNFHQPLREMSVLVGVGVSYGSDLEHVERVTIEVAKDVMTSVDGGVPDFEPFIRFHTFGDSSVDFNVIMRASEFTDQFLIRHEFIKRLHRRYQAEGIEIPFPIRTLVTTDSGNGARPAGHLSIPASR